MECVTKPNINCCPNGNCSDSHCPTSHGCCWQDPGSGKKATLGLCVKKDSNGGDKNCDYSRGIPRRNCKDPQNKFVQSNSYENYAIVSQEGYSKSDDDCDCSNWNNAFMVFFIIIALLMFLALSMYMKNVRIR
jgi:hypothetical protein